MVFVDLGTMLSFEQLASVLRSRGVEVAHLTVASNPLARLASRALFHSTSFFATQEELLAALRRLDVSRVVDIQCPEFLLDDVVHAAREAGVPRAVLTELELRFAWRDKFAVARSLQQAGLAAPRVRDLEDCRREDLLTDFGLPLVIKDRVGSGGEGVRIVRRAEELGEAVEALGGEKAHLYAEEFLPGATMCYATAIVHGRPVQGVVYHTLQGREAEGPSSLIEVVRDNQVLAIGQRVAELVGGSGLLNLDLVRDEHGDPRVVDVNLRSWHSVVALGQLGFDYPQAYLQGLDLGRAEHGVVTSIGLVHVFPDHEETGEGCSEGLRRFLDGLWRHRRILPVRYLALQVLLFARRSTGRG
ncbi:hypothetical protein GCM10009599_22710 [Luteococcus peritonei]